MLRAACATAAERPDPVVHEVYHIVEDPGGIEHLVDCEVPAEKYYEALGEDMARRHPKASRFVLEHLNELEPFLDVSILSGLQLWTEQGLRGRPQRLASRPSGEPARCYR